MPRVAAAIVAVVVSAFCGPAAAASLPAGWQVWTPDGKRPAQFEVGEDGTVSVRAEAVVSFLIREVTDGERDRPVLAWRWRVDAAPPPTDLTRKGADDRALAIHLWYPLAGSAWSVKGQLGRWLGYPVPGYALTYVWGGAQPAGTILRNPYMDHGRLIVLESADAPTGRWITERVDVTADFTRAFGHPPPAAPEFLAVSADSDDTGTVAEGVVAGLGFVGEGGAGG